MNGDFVPNCNFGYSYYNMKTESDDITYFLRNLAWGKNDDFQFALKQLILRLRKVEGLLDVEQGKDKEDDIQNKTV